MQKQSLITSRNALIWLVPLSIIGLSGYRLLRSKATNKSRIYPNEFDVLDTTEFAPIKDLVIAQSKVESANYTSALYKRAFNAFGMKNATKRKQLGYHVTGDPYRHYVNLDQSIRDFLLYLDYVNFPSNVSGPLEYAKELKRRGYFESDLSDYVKAIQSWL